MSIAGIGGRAVLELPLLWCGLEAGMKTIRVQYDAYNRQFKLLDPPAATLHDGETYLILDTLSNDFDLDLALPRLEELAHA